MADQIDPELQKLLADEIEALRNIVKIKSNYNVLVLCVVGDDEGNLHVNVSSTEVDVEEALNLIVGVNEAVNIFIKGV